MEIPAEADLDGGEVIVAAGEGEARARNGGVDRGEEVKDGGGRHGDLAIEAGQLGGDCDLAHGSPGELKEGVGGEAGAGAVGLPLMQEQTGVGVDVAEVCRVCGTGDVAAMLGVSAADGLRPESVEHEAEVLGALRLAGVRGAELG